jgi:hypothetical protein
LFFACMFSTSPGLYGHLKAVLIEASSIAIWNGNQVAVVMAVGVWGINVVFLIEGGSFPFPSTAGHITYTSMIS